MPTWLVNLGLILLERYLPKIIEGFKKKLAAQKENAEVKRDLKKAVKIKNRQHRADNILNALKR